MAMTYSAALKTARMNAVVSQAGASAKLEIGTAGMGTVLATITRGATMGTVSGDTLTISGVPLSDTSADATGVAAEARIRTSGNADVITGLTVGTSGTHIVIDNTSINAGQTVTLVSGTIQHG